MSISMKLTTDDHRRDTAGLTYVYPVLSRRSGGLSVGINLNPNNACNWRCIYCQVPDLKRGAAPAIDLIRLRAELTGMLQDILHGDFYRRFQIDAEHPEMRDIAISGNGEPTSSNSFLDVTRIIGEVAEGFGLRGRVNFVLITNGSLMGRRPVQEGITRWSDLGGEIWFKLDSATREGIARINGAACSPVRLARNLEIASRSCPTWLQTCLFALDGFPPEEAELQAYLDFVAERLRQGLPLRGVRLYGLARPSMQTEAPRLSALPANWMQSFAERVRNLGLPVQLSV